KEILTQLEQNKGASPLRKAMPNLLPGFTPPTPKAKPPAAPVPPPEHPLLVALQDTDPNSLTPLEALNRLTEWKLLWGTK
ncbi:MAG: hypothetical protein RRY20_06300, partial [Bilophila sp.]